MTIPRGRDAAQSIGALAEASGQSDRAVERKVLAMVLDGTPIVACENGIYVSDSADEIDAYADSLEDRIRSQLQRIRALRKAAEARRQPMTLWEAA
jgi:predicted TIM-barrel enzyme